MAGMILPAIGGLAGLLGGGAGTGLMSGLGSALGFGSGAAASLPGIIAEAATSPVTGAAMGAGAGAGSGGFMSYLPSIFTGASAFSQDPALKSLFSLGSTVAGNKGLGGVSLGQLFDIGSKLGGTLMGKGGEKSTQSRSTSGGSTGNMPTPATPDFLSKAMEQQRQNALLQKQRMATTNTFGGYTPTALRMSNLGLK